MIDQHVHSNYSIDSNETMENYINNTTEKILTFTEHYDFFDPFNDFITVTYDINGQREEMKRLEKKYDITLLQGIELGYSRKAIEESFALLKQNHFDLVLLSVHHNDEYDYMMDIPNMTNTQVMEEYLSRVEEALNHNFDADVLTHLDFGLRNIEITLEDLKTQEDKLVRILKKLIVNNMSLEINAKGVVRYKTTWMYDYFLDLYKSVGGIDIVVNSDAHVKTYYRSGFEEIKNFLLTKGFKKINYYKNREKHSLSLER